MGQILANDYYMTLGVSPQASVEEIDAAYKEAIRRVHPDVTSSAGVPIEAGEREFRTHLAAQINAAATVLRNPAKRAAYDLDRAAAERKAAARAARTTPTAQARPKQRYTNPSYQAPPPTTRATSGRGQSYEPPLSPIPKWEPPATSGQTPTYRAAGPTFDPIREDTSRGRAYSGPPRSLADWFLHHRTGQWLLVVAVAVISYLAASVFDPSEPFIFSVRIAVVFMVAVAIATRNLSNPFGDVFLALMRFADEMLNITGTNTMGKRR